MSDLKVLDSKKHIRNAFFLNFFLATVELVGGIAINSLAVVSNAMHDFVDAFTLGLTWRLEKVSSKGKDHRYSYGYRRFSILAAIINASILTLVTLYILFEAVDRFYSPSPVDSVGIIAFAGFGMVINFLSVWFMKNGKSRNEKMITLELTGDLMTWLVIFITSLVNLFYQMVYVDTVLSVLIALYIFFNIIKNVRYLAKIFLQGVPDHDALDLLQKEILAFPMVNRLHDVHLWSLDGEYHVFSAHVILSSAATISDGLELKNLIRSSLARFSVEHSTLEIEFGDESEPQM